MASERFKNIRVYYLAFVVYWGILLFGYDTGIAGGVIAHKAFQDNFGLTGATQKHKDNVSSNVVAVLQGGAFFGALGSAPVSSRLGRKWTIMVFTAIFCVGAVLQTIAGPGSGGLNLIYVGRVVAGVGVGAISAVAPAYVSECCPKDVRGRITGMFQIAVALGVMISYFTNYGVSKHIHSGALVWRIPFGIQLVPGGILALGLLVAPESPRYLARAGKLDQALKNLAYLRYASTDDPAVRAELAEIEATIMEEKEARAGLGWKEAFLGKGNFIRFVIAFTIFTLQQFAGQNSVGYYAPQIFASIGFVGTTPSLLASGVYGIIKVVATAVFIFFGVERFGRRWSLFWSAMWMGILFYMVAALLKTHPTNKVVEGVVPPASKAMAALLYIYCVAYSFGWGPLPWVYVSDIFPNRTRHYGLSVASGTQWLFNFTISKITPMMKTALGWKLFITFATINIGGMAVFSYFLPETKGRSLEEMDIIFGAIRAEDRERDIRKAAHVVDGEGPGSGGSDAEKGSIQQEKST